MGETIPEETDTKKGEAQRRVDTEALWEVQQLRTIVTLDPMNTKRRVFRLIEGINAVYDLSRNWTGLQVDGARNPALNGTLVWDVTIHKRDGSKVKHTTTKAYI